MRATSWFFVAVAAVGLAVLTVGPAEPGQAPSAGLRPLPDDAWNQTTAHHLLFRAGFGGSPAEVKKLCALGLRKAVDSLVAYHAQPDLALPPPDAIADGDDLARRGKLTPQERQKLAQQRRRNDQQFMVQVRHWWVQRMIQSPRPLEENLVLFWHGHFATEWRTVRNSQAMLAQNQLFRKHAAGNFGKLLHAIIRDPAMLRYLDNNRNTKRRPNENLAREIMELFAMGVDAGYTENDIKQGARALTGHTFDPRTWKYRYAAGNHDPGEKTIFGQTGKWDGDQFVDLILKQPATARFIARKLFIHFAHDNPDEKVIDQLAKILRDNDYELAPVLRTLFLSEEFYSERSRGTQIKSPVQLVIGSLRTLRLQDATPAFAAAAMRSLGQDLFEPPNVKGWEGGRAWINTNTSLARASFPALLLGGADRIGPRAKAFPRKGARGQLRPLGKPFDAVAYLQGAKLDTPDAVVAYLARALFAVPLSQAQQKELAEFLGPLPPSAEWADMKQTVNPRLAALLVLMMGLPEYQLT